MLNMNVTPFYDDYDENKNFHKILFRPEHAVQARELTQLQSILQSQIKRHGDHVFKNGTLVIPGNVYYDGKANYVKIESVSNGLAIEQYIDLLKNKSIFGQTSGVKAIVVNGIVSTESEPAAIYVKYQEGGAVNGLVTGHSKFIQGEKLYCAELDLTIQVQNVPNHVGFGAIAMIAEGIYYVNGYFVRVSPQSIILEKFNNTPSVKVGLLFKDSIVTELEDSSLYDNALGYNNFGSPGACRYKIELILGLKPADEVELTADQAISDSIKFIDLIEVKEGEVQFLMNSTKYAEIDRMLAKRTYDESGDYIVDQFSAEASEHRNNNRGAWESGVAYLQGDVVTAVRNGTTLSYWARNDGVSGVNAISHNFGTASDGVISWTQTSNPFYNFGKTFSLKTDSVRKQKEDAEKINITVSTGKAYIRGTEVVKSSKSILEAPKARSYKEVNAAQLFSPNSDFFDVYSTSIKGCPNISICELLNLKDSSGTVIGTCRASALFYVNGNIRLFVFDTKMNAGKEFSKQVRSVENGSASFVATLVVDYLLVTGNINISASSTTITGYGSKFETELSVGMNIDIPNTGIRMIASITSDISATLTSAISATAVTNGRIRSTSVNYTSSAASISVMPHSHIKTTRSSSGDIDSLYQVTKTVAQSAGVISLTSTADEIVSTNMLFIPNVSGAAAIVSNGQTVAAGTLIYQVTKKNSSAREKTKTLQTKTIDVYATTIKEGESNNVISGLTRYNSFSSKIITLTEADVIRIIRIAEMTDSNTSTFIEQGAVDVTRHFTLDNGQKPHFYDISTITSNGYRPSKPLRITFEYFSHSAGDFFSVDSYSNIPPNMIPKYNGISLRDCLDFRPRVSDIGTDFSSVGASVGQVITPGSLLTMDYSYYLPRLDRIVLASNGTLSLVQGESSDTPTQPNVSSNGLSLFDLTLAPYTDNTSQDNVILSKVNHRRYTMADIGKLETRVSNLEDYVALSSLEKSTADIKIVDQFGLDRFKSGFFVDQFKDTKVSSQSEDCSFSVDVAEKCGRPNFYRTIVKLTEADGTTTATRTSNHYSVNGSKSVTLPWSKIPIIEQRVASFGELINPFQVASFVGNASIYPENDVWLTNVDAGSTFNVVEGNFQSEFAARNGETRETFSTATNFSAGASWNSSGRSSSSSVDTTQRGRQITQTTTTNSSNFNVSAWANWSNSTTGTQTATTSVTERFDLTDASISANSTKVEFMRAQPILISVEGMKPNSKIYPYFNGIDVKKYVKNLSVFITSGQTGGILGIAKTGHLATDSIARTADSLLDLQKHPDIELGQFNFPRGDIVTDNTGKTHLVVGSGLITTQSYGEKFCVYCLSDSVSSNVTSISANGETLSVVSVIPKTSYSNEEDISTNSRGNFYGVFLLPKFTFRGGKGTIVLSDAQTYGDSNETTRASVDFSSDGTITSFSQNFTQERNANVFTASVTNTTLNSSSFSATTINSSNSSTAVSTERWVDPLAQTFMLPASLTRGAFIPSVGLFFNHKDANEKEAVHVQIVETLNGYPTRNVVQLGHVILQPEEIQASSTQLIETIATFPEPVYLESGKEYAIVVISDKSFTYKLWVARMNDASRIDKPGYSVTEQAYAGSLFKSQNSSTWEAAQDEDMTFVLYRSKFDVSKQAVLSVSNSNLAYTRLNSNPFGYTNSSNVVRVYHRNNGLRNGMTVKFKDIVLGNANGGFQIENNTNYTVTNCSLDSYVILLSGTNKFLGDSGRYGGEIVNVMTNIEYDTVKFVAPNVNFNGVTYAHSYLTETDTTKESIHTHFIENTIIDFNSPRFVKSQLNQTNGSSLEYRIIMGSDDDSISPVVDLSNVSAELLSNRINFPTVGDNYGSIDTSSPYNTNSSDIVKFTKTGSNGVTWVGVNGDATTNATFRVEAASQLADLVEVGCQIVLTNNVGVTVTSLVYGESMASNGDVTFTLDKNLTVNNITGGTLYVYVYKNYIAEFGPRKNSAVCRYISQPVILTNPASALKFLFAANIQPSADISLFYRTYSANNISALENSNWISVPLNYKKTGNTMEYIDQEYLVEDIPTFSAYQVKIVPVSENKSQIAKLKDLRVIALA
jgi:hypothetical protein